MKSKTELKPAVLILAFLVLLAGAGQAFGGALERAKKTGEYGVAIRLDHNPPVIGRNPLAITIRDGSGRIVSDASVLVNYYMPPMPRMAPMNYKVHASFKGGIYRTEMNFIMEGPWVIAVKFNRGGKQAGVKFNVDAR